jgi:hypothetical protein
LPTKNNQDETYRSFFANTIHTTEVFFEGGLVTNNLLMPKALVCLQSCHHDCLKVLTYFSLLIFCFLV